MVGSSHRYLRIYPDEEQLLEASDRKIQLSFTLVNHLLGGPLKGRLLALAVNIRLGYLPGANALAYWGHLKVTKKMKCCQFKS